VGDGWPCLLAAASPPVMNLESLAASPVNGTWIIRGLVLHLSDCQGRVCGRIVGLSDAGKRASQCGMTIVWGLEATGPNEWSGGSILDPNDHIIYRLSAVLKPDDTLHARIFKGIPMVGKTEILTRVDLRSFAGQCPGSMTAKLCCCQTP
jgi:uncharacterized protein (DUF2147 family)